MTGAIVGARTPAQLDGWIDAASLVLTAQDIDGIASSLQCTKAGSGAAKAA